MLSHILISSLLSSLVISSPLSGDASSLEARNKPKPDPGCRGEVDAIVSTLSSAYASPFCSSLLHIPTATATTTSTTKATATVTTGSASTLYTFLPGNPPSKAKARRDLEARNDPADPPIPTYLGKTPLPLISKACSCLNLPTRTTTATATVTATTTTTVAASPVYITKYPCADPFPTRIPTLPFGDATSPTDLGLQNGRFFTDTPQGQSGQACCNACFFELENCINAYYYSYQGCVYSQATNLTNASGQGVDATCPAGYFKGLTYVPDTKYDFRSQGTLAGPCGQTYNNL
ncbi:MAG: hypothetical protein LQ350_004059 [Teloschistes chrysophthalmus]|nr:MAG: hypothetical protein LQ350_004059 [Niorma chrysophthalma]